MKIDLTTVLVAALAAASLVMPAQAADRMRAGQWTGDTIAAGRTYHSSNCVTPGDAEAMNGDAVSIRGYLERTIPPSICKLSNITATGLTVSYTSACGGAAPAVVTTIYHGDHFETVDTKGTKSTGQRVGACG